MTARLAFWGFFVLDFESVHVTYLACADLEGVGEGDPKCLSYIRHPIGCALVNWLLHKLSILTKAVGALQVDWLPHKLFVLNKAIFCV